MGLILVSFTIRDADGDKTAMPVYIPDTGLVHADVAGFADDYAALLDDCVEGVIDSINITYQHTLPGGLDSTPVANSEVQKGGLIKFGVADTPYTWSMRIPAIIPGKFVADAVDLTDADVLALITAMTAGLTPVATLVSPSNRYELDLDSTLTGVKSFRK